MKKIIADQAFISGVKEKLSRWTHEQLMGLPAGDGGMEVLEIAEYPLYRLVMKAEVQTRTVDKFRKAGAAVPGNTQPPPEAGAIDAWSVDAGTVNDFTAGKKEVEIPASLLSEPCKKCGGTGKLTCPVCQGQKSIYCDVCRGDGTLVCPKCKKTLKVDCQDCKGRGKVYSNEKQAYVACPLCEGKGSLPCRDCKNGFKPCDECGGKGKIPCKDCGQTGSLECQSCSGKGNYVSGLRVTITSYPVEEKIDIPNNDIPENILSGEFPAVSYTVETVISPAGQGADTGVPEALSDQIDILQKKITVPPEGKIVKREISLERKSFYGMKYRAGDKESSAWFLITGEKLLFERKLLREVYSGVLKELDLKIKQGDMKAARQIIKSIENIPALKNDAESIEKELAQGVLPSYITGGLIGAVISSAGAVLYEYRAWHSSFNLFTVIALTLGVILLVSACGAALLNTVCPERLDSKAKRLAAAALPAVLAALLLLGCAAAGLNPAGYLDAKQMRHEYDAYFPYGLRTLAAKEDVEFLRRLVDKYEPTGIDLASQKKDLKWLSGKLKSDEKAIDKIEQTARDIEQISESRKTAHKKNFKYVPKIYVK